MFFYFALVQRVMREICICALFYATLSRLLNHETFYVPLYREVI
jgi:hypothetical protein